MGWSFINKKKIIQDMLQAFVQEEYTNKGKERPDLNAPEVRLEFGDWNLRKVGITEVGYDTKGKVSVR